MELKNKKSEIAQLRDCAQAPRLTRCQKKQIAVKYLKLKNDWVRVADIEEDLGINMQGPVVSLKLDGMLVCKNQQGATYHYKVWRLR